MTRKRPNNQTLVPACSIYMYRTCIYVYVWQDIYINRYMFLCIYIYICAHIVYVHVHVYLHVGIHNIRMMIQLALGLCIQNITASAMLAAPNTPGNFIGDPRVVEQLFRLTAAKARQAQSGAGRNNNQRRSNTD